MKDASKDICNYWQTNSWPVKYLSYRFRVTEQYIRNLVTGLEGPEKKKKSLSAYHRAIGQLLLDKRLKNHVNKIDFAKACGISYLRLNNLERGYDDITYTEILRTEILEQLTLLDTFLLEVE